MDSDAQEVAQQLLTLLETVFKSENVELEILHDKYPGREVYRVWGFIGLGTFSFPIGTESFDLSSGLAWEKQSEFAYAHQWIGPHTRRRKSTYRKISKFWEMVERLNDIGYERVDYDENPYSFTMLMNHPTPVQLDPPEARERLISIIRKTLAILQEANPWAMEG